MAAGKSTAAANSGWVVFEDEAKPVDDTAACQDVGPQGQHAGRPRARAGLGPSIHGGDDLLQAG